MLYIYKCCCNVSIYIKNFYVLVRKKPDELFHPVYERSEFYSMADLCKPPFLFNPVPQYEEYVHKNSPSALSGEYGDRSPGTENIDSTQDKYDDILGPPAKIQRRSSGGSTHRGDMNYGRCFSRRKIRLILVSHESFYTSFQQRIS